MYKKIPPYCISFRTSGATHAHSPRSHLEFKSDHSHISPSRDPGDSPVNGYIKKIKFAQLFKPFLSVILCDDLQLSILQDFFYHTSYHETPTRGRRTLSPVSDIGTERFSHILTQNTRMLSGVNWLYNWRDATGFLDLGCATIPFRLYTGALFPSGE
ncbi:hypothetical protein EVAR_24481_1 [Eumeta japonica]|uniref:Uncharacterized protein n=1 Tax=Eumeta variegata TaxID=151549 RepID=A0A4C1WZ14_EUMVA|nr:hypothetical protein EVAR_24481_1 [Eumeta japonica]